jgi:hypothetical protein
MKKTLPPQEYLAARLDYDPDTGKLFWKARTPDMFTDGKRPREWSCANWNSKHASKEAFTSVSSIGYKTGLIDGVGYVASRIIWKLVHGYDPIEIDHINRAKDDNRLCNLREATRSENCLNRGLLRNNKSGISGVYFETGSGLWVVEVAGIRYGRRKDKDAAIKLRESVG